MSTSILPPLDPHHVYTLTFEKLNSWITMSSSSPECVHRKTILENISGEVSPGRIIALMGASGSGKTSLLSLLGGRTPPNIEIEGKITINGKLPYTSEIRKRFGFVLQDDLFYDTLTVRETLLYAALLRLPEDMCRQEKENRVDVLMKTLGIEKSQDTIIGGFMRRGISGGERKRVSVAHELIINPSILFLDEPTSGLDSSSAHNLVVLLKDIASSGRAIMTTIHQPSSRLYNQLDQVMLLHEGKVAYQGNALDAENWFASHGLPLSHGTNLADHIIDCVTLSPADRVRDIIEACYNVHALPCMRSQENEGDETCIHIDEQSSGNNTHRRHHVSLQKLQCFVRDVFGPSEKSIGTRLYHTIIMTHKLMRVKRFESFSLDQWFLVFAISVITGLLWFQKGKQNDLMSALDMTGLVFFLILFPAFRSLFSALFCYSGDYRILVKEKPCNMYSMSIYYWARSLSDLPLDVSMPTLLVIIVYWLGYLKATAGAFFATWTSILLVLFVAQAWGLWIGGLTMEPRKAQTVSTIIILTFLLVGGFYVKDVPVWIGWIKYFSFIYWGNNLITKIQFSDVHIEACDGSSCSIIPQDELQERLNILVDPNARQWPEVIILIAMFIGLRILAYVTLEWQTFSSFQSL